jgi:hypothetical protein
MPQVEYRCNTRASQFAYVPPLTDAKAKEISKVETAVLSFTNRSKQTKANKVAAASLSTSAAAKVCVCLFSLINYFSSDYNNNTKWR